MPRKSPDPRRRMGAYKRLEQVPERYRLRTHAASYDGRDVWEEYVAATELSGAHLEISERAARYWKEFIRDRVRHHALAQPVDVNDWCETLLSNRQRKTVYQDYWVQLEQFYRWLLFHPDHPHVYNPVLMAAANHPTAQRIWERKMDAKRER